MIIRINSESPKLLTIWLKAILTCLYSCKITKVQNTLAIAHLVYTRAIAITYCGGAALANVFPQFSTFVILHRPEFSFHIGFLIPDVQTQPPCSPANLNGPFAGPGTYIGRWVSADDAYWAICTSNGRLLGDRRLFGLN